MTFMISANSLFHFTSAKENLISILDRGLYVRYSLEIFDSILEEGESEIVIPMTCFCDIPLSQTKSHSNTYGKYAIGLSKTWGINNKVSPVHYVYPNSTTTEVLQYIMTNLHLFFDVYEDEEETEKGKRKYMSQIPSDVQEFLEDEKSQEAEKVINRVTELQEQLAHFMRFLKPYEGRIYRNGQYSKEIQNFYNEREWRYVPPKDLLAKIEVKDCYKASFYKNPSKRRYINMKLASHKILTFSPDDIRFVITKSEKEIPKLIDDIHRIFKKRATYDQLTLLSTRVISLEQIVEDI